jgi:hypothetical protein
MLSRTMAKWISGIRLAAAILLILYAARSLCAESENLIEDPSFESSNVFPWHFKN